MFCESNGNRPQQKNCGMRNDDSYNIFNGRGISEKKKKTINFPISGAEESKARCRIRKELIGLTIRLCPRQSSSIDFPCVV